MTLTCPACGGRVFKFVYRIHDPIAIGDIPKVCDLSTPIEVEDVEICASCGFAGKPVMMSDKDRAALREQHERATAARTLPEGYDQARKDRDCDELFGPQRYEDTPQGTRMKG